MMKNDFTNVKVVFLDLDGTLLNSKKEITSKTKDVLNKLNDLDIKYIIASGRANYQTREFAKMVNASSITLSNNGALVYDNKNLNIIFKSTIDEEHLVNIWSKCNELGISCFFNTLNNRYANSNVEHESIVINDIKELNGEEVYQVVVVADTLSNINEINDYVNSRSDIEVSNASLSFYDQLVSNSYYIDIVNTGISKGVGVKKIIEYLNITKENCMCFGDNLNDLSMFQECLMCVAMGNAHKELKKISKYETSSNNEDGVAEFLITNVVGE